MKVDTGDVHWNLWTHSSLGPSQTLRKEAIFVTLPWLLWLFKAISLSSVSIVAIFSIVTVDFFAYRDSLAAMVILITSVIIILGCFHRWLREGSTSVSLYGRSYPVIFRFGFFFPRFDSTNLCTCDVDVLFLGLTGTQSLVTITAIFQKWVS